MTTTAVVDSQCCELINQYLFDNVWNEPVSEYRTNIHPQLISKDSKVGTFRVLDATIFLPTRNRSYYVYFIKAGDLNIEIVRQVFWCIRLTAQALPSRGIRDGPSNQIHPVSILSAYCQIAINAACFRNSV